MENNNNGGDATDKNLKAVDKRVREILRLAPVDRFREIIDSENALELVRSLPYQDFLVTIKEIGYRDAIPLIELASPKQLRFIGDIAWWKGDELDNDTIVEWFNLLIECGDEKIVDWLSAVDGEFLVTVFRKFMFVTKPEKDEMHLSQENGPPPYTLEGVYHLHFITDDAYRIFSHVMKIFSNVRLELYMRAMEAMVREVGPETEELARKWRDGRLRDIGIPDMDEAVEAYRYLDEKTFWKLPKKEKVAEYFDQEIPPNFPIALQDKESHLLIEAMRKIDDPAALDDISQEIAHLVNRVMVADKVELADTTAIFKASEKVRATLSIGLEILTDGDVEKSATLIRERWLLHIFQIGYSQALDLTRRAYKMSQQELISIADPLLGKNLKNIFNAIKKPRPEWFDPQTQKPRAFLSLDEIAEGMRVLFIVEYLADLFFLRLKLLKPVADSWVLESIHSADITYETVLRTAFANAAAGRGFAYKALRKQDLKAILENAFEKKPDAEGLRRIKAKVKSDLVALLEEIGTAQDKTEKEIRDALVGASLDSLESELGKLDPAKPIEPKFIQGLAIRK